SLSLGQSESYINKIENGRTLPSLHGLLYICYYFGITQETFFRTEVQAPTRVQELTAAAEKLSPEVCKHLLLLLRDLANH
ncbi:MAG: helix-turn-helix transcriptional regulator, partial [bacterium]